MRGRAKQIVIHDAHLTVGVPAGLLVRLFCAGKRRRFRTPANLTIILVHNRSYPTLMERSLDYLGVEYVTLKPPAGVRWRHTLKNTAMLDYLSSGRCTTEYVMFCDSDDALMRDDPAKAVALLEAAQCDMLISTTKYADYRGMPERAAMTTALAPVDLRSKPRAAIHLNSGVFIARRTFLAEYLTTANQYITSDDLEGDWLRIFDGGAMISRLPEFPRGIGDEQIIMRYLFPAFYPRMRLDYGGALARR